MNPKLHTPVCDLLGCDLPIVLAGMGGPSRSELVAAVTNAGGFGFLGMVREPPELIRSEVEKARAALKEAPGVTVIDHQADEGYVTQVEAAGDDPVYVSRIRRDPTVAHGLNLWVVSDNLRKGAALNAVQIAEVLASDYLGAAKSGAGRKAG